MVFIHLVTRHLTGTHGCLPHHQLCAEKTKTQALPLRVHVTKQRDVWTMGYNPVWAGETRMGSGEQKGQQTLWPAQSKPQEKSLKRKHLRQGWADGRCWMGGNSSRKWWEKTNRQREVEAEKLRAPEEEACLGNMFMEGMSVSLWLYHWGKKQTRKLVRTRPLKILNAMN